MGNNRPFRDLTGEVFGRWTVLYQAEPRYDNSGHLRRFWVCECSCDKHTVREVAHRCLTSGWSTSCGCYRVERAIPAMNEAAKKYNGFILHDNYCEVIDGSGNIALIDNDDIELIKKYYWYKVTLEAGTENEVSYMYTHIRNSETKKDHKLSMHEYLTGQKYVDHKNHDGLDNRRCNLRFQKDGITSNQGYNNINMKRRRNNTSGYTGVYYDKRSGKWTANIGINYKTKRLGTFDTFEEAVEARKAGEEKYYSGWSYKQSMEENVV